MPEHSNVQTQSASRVRSCALLALGPVLLIVALVTIFIINNRPVSISVPTPKMPLDNGYNYFVRAGGMTVGTGPMSHSSKKLSSWTVPELAKFAHDNAAGLALVRHGLTKSYMCPPERSPGAMFPELAGFREIARTLVGESLYYEAIKDYGGAVDSRLDAVEMGATIPRGGVLITALVGIAVESIAENGLNHLLPKLNRDELARAAKRLERVQAKRVLFADVIEREGYASVTGVVEMMHSPGLIKYAPLMYGSGGGGVAQNALEVARFAFTNKQALVRNTLDYYRAYAAEQRRLPYGVKSKIPAPNYYLSQMLMPVFARARGAVEKSSALATVIQVDVALRRYRLDHGSYATTLADLVPTYLKRVPVDPFGLGKPLRYKPVNGGRGFLLYSLGPNLKDDAGTPGSFQNSFATGDVVAGQF